MSTSSKASYQPNQSRKRKISQRRTKILTNEEKIEAIKRVLSGERKAQVAQDIKVPESTLRGWCKNATKYEMQGGSKSNVIGKVMDAPTAAESPRAMVWIPKEIFKSCMALQSSESAATPYCNVSGLYEGLTFIREPEYTKNKEFDNNDEKTFNYITCKDYEEKYWTNIQAHEATETK